MQAKIKEIIRGKVLNVYKEQILLYYKGAIILCDNTGKNPKVLDRLKWPQYCLAQIRVLERLLRLEPRMAFLNDNRREFILSWNGKLININKFNLEKKVLYVYREGMKNPLSINKIEKIPNFEDGYIFGDYFSNPFKECVALYQIQKDQCKKIAILPAGTALHIHGCIPDPYENRVLILTGDDDKESGIWSATDNFKKIEPLLTGKQQYRACVAFPTKEGIIFATDTPLESNAIYFYSNKERTVKKIYDMPGPCIYGTQIKNKKDEIIYVLSTSIEPDSSLSRWHYFITSKRGKGVKDNYSYLIVGNMERGFKQIKLCQKDIWPMALFQFGNIQFLSDSENPNELYLYMLAVKQYDGKTIKYKIEI